jgi:hypothetical protein
MEFISHCIKRNPNKLEGRATAGMLIIFLVLSLLGWIYLTQASHVATTSRRNQELEAEKVRLHQENMELMVEIATYESISRLAPRAQELGFVAIAPDSAEFVAVSAPALSQLQEAPDSSPLAYRPPNDALSNRHCRTERSICKLAPTRLHLAPCSLGRR